MATKVGSIIHYFDKIGVGVLALENAGVKIGDSIRVGQKGDEATFTQTVESMQVDHKPVETAKKGDEVGLKLDQVAKKGTLVYKE